MAHPAIERVVAAGAALGECPVWSVAEACLYWVDIEGRRVHRFDPVSGDDVFVGTAGRPGAVMLSGREGRLLLAIEQGLAWLDWDSGRLEPWVQLEGADTGNLMNDARCDPVGRLWVGSMFADLAAGVTSGSLHRVEADGSSTTVQSGIGVANGLAFAPDGRTMYFADTPTRTVLAYDYDPTTGSRARERPFFTFDELPGRPDGACVDVDGCYWLACVYGSSILRITPDGRLDRRIELPVARPTRCTFGGDDLDVLYVTSIGADAEADGDDGDIAGDVLAFSPGVGGTPEQAFAV